MSEIQRFDQNHRRSRCVVHGGTVYLAGQVADDKTSGIVEQTRQALRKVDELLSDAGTDRSRLLSATIWLKNMDDFAGMNSVWDAWVVPEATPARCCGRAELADPAYLVEIIVVAAL
jgi:enamine deaminase RidA (YjgF/YER057c/UK114 family)